jgi:hypothetical protein
MSDKAFRPGLKTLCDFSAAVSAPSLDELMAIVAATDKTFGAARQFKALASTGPLDVNVFGNRREAAAWLEQAGP